MSDQLLNLLKLGLLALLYLFFARVLYAVWSEVRSPRTGGTATATAAPTAPPAPPAAAAPAPAASKRRKGTVGRLVVIAPKAQKGLTYSTAAELVIGRAPSCAISLPDDTFVSQLHARVHPDDGRVVVEDLGSTNGTFLNGNRLSRPETVHRGDRIQVGSTVLEAE
jgi:pSer/pThr/pTyr-binding forkhead associated (FHA) protein